MSVTKNKKPFEFRREDQLLLQQLLTRQALESLESSPANREEAEAENGDRELSSTMYYRWQLLPEHIELHDWQHKCLEIWLESCRGTVKVATGGGKTLFALAAAQTLQNEVVSDLRLAIVVPTIPLMNQWAEELSESNIPKSRVAFLGGGERVPENPDIRIVICVINSARDRLPALVKKFGWSEKLLLVVDECHRANASEAKRVFESCPAYTLGLSATPETDQGVDAVPTNDAYAVSEVGQALGPIIFEFSLKESLAAGLLTPFEVWHVGLPLNLDEASEHARLSREISELRKDLQAIHRRSRSKQNFIAWCQTVASRDGPGNASRFIGMASERKRLIYRAASRFNLTLKILSSAMKEPDRRVIVFHESIDDINNLFISAVDANIPAVLEHSKLPTSLRYSNIDAFRKGVARTIISAKSLVEGFNVPSADIGIIAASSGSVRQRIQSLGRMLRKKETGETALIFVLYVKDTEDEAIYQKADWEAVIGAGRNRYCEWTPNTEPVEENRTLEGLLHQLHEVNTPPRVYRPPCHEVDVKSLEFGSEYPAQTKGTDLRVDQAGNLRTDDDALTPASHETINKILEINQYRRAVRTPCGHLICRTGVKQGHNDTWVFLGLVDEPEVLTDKHVEKLLVKRVSGRRVIARKVGRNIVFARGPDTASSNEAQDAQALLDWIRSQEGALSTSIHELYWDGEKKFWIEINGERVCFDEAKSGLEFPQ